MVMAVAHKLDRRPRGFANVKIRGGHGFGCTCGGWSVIVGDLKSAIRLHTQHKAQIKAAAEIAVS